MNWNTGLRAVYVRFLLNMVNQGPGQNTILMECAKQKSVTFLSAGPRNSHLRASI